MQFNVKVFVNGKEVNSSDLPNYQIKNKVIDRIVNDVIDRVNSNIKDEKFAS